MIEIKVPATSANIGPGFDCLGIALNLYNKFYIEEIERGLIIEGCDPSFANEDNLVFTSMKKCFEKIGYKYNGIRIIIKADIPVSRGLGSSAACILGGVVGANELAGNVLSKEEILELATKIEGHPDNITPALFGGMTVSITENNKVYYDNIDIAKGIKFYTLIPNFKLSTEEARKILPDTVSHKDAVFNVGRTALMLTAMINGNFDLMKVGVKDRLHQEYRGTLIEDFNYILDECNKLNTYGVFLSGAGPTIIVAVQQEDDNILKAVKKKLEGLNRVWDLKELNVDYKGVSIIK